MRADCVATRAGKSESKPTTGTSGVTTAVRSDGAEDTLPLTARNPPGRLSAGNRRSYIFRRIAKERADRPVTRSAVKEPPLSRLPC